MRSSSWDVYRSFRESIQHRSEHGGKLAYLLVSDLHLTDNPRDEYRWGIFGQIDSVIQTYQPSCLVILGDLTDKKDNHSSELVNRLLQPSII